MGFIDWLAISLHFLDPLLFGIIFARGVVRIGFAMGWITEG